MDVPIDEKTQLANWDCPESVDFEHFARNIQYARKHGGTMPEGFDSNEENNVHDGSKLLSPKTAEELNRILAHLVDDPETVFVFVDGFMLYWDEGVRSQLDFKISINASFDTLKVRREKRQGYHTLEGYWVDPPGYFDKIVWPEYIRLSKHNATLDDVLTIDTDKNSIDEAALIAAGELSRVFQ